MGDFTHNFIHSYNGIAAFGMNRSDDEDTLKLYLQMFSDDNFMEKFIPRLSNDELDDIYTLINNLLKKYATEDEYHNDFLKDGTH